MKQIKSLALSLALFTAATSQAAQPILPSFIPKGSLPFTPDQLSQIQKHDHQIKAFSAMAAVPTTWQQVGTRWAVTVDGKGAVQGLYDLSIPDGILPGFGVFLGRFGGPDFTFKHVGELLAQAKALSNDNKSKDQLDQAMSSVAKEQANGGSGLLADDWYKNVPWTQQAVKAFSATSQQAAPLSFTLADINYDKAAISGDLFRSSLSYLSRFDVDLGRFQFKQQADGSYAITVAPKISANASTLPQPAKLADAQDTTAAFWQSVEQTAGQAVLGFAISQIPEPTVAAIVGTALDRYLTLRFDVLRYHREAAREMVEAAVNGESPYGGFSSLTSDELKGFGESLYISRFNLSTMWNWLWKGEEGAWKADMAGDVSNASSATAFLNQKGYQYGDLNPRYALSTGSGQHKLFVLAESRVLGSNQEPVTAIDYDHPLTQTEINAAVEVASTIVHFGSHYIPTFGSVVPIVFDAVVRDYVQGTKYWGSRLSAHLEEREAVSHENWDNEIATLLLQRINPCDLMPADSKAYVAQVAAQLGLSSSAPASSSVLK